MFWEEYEWKGAYLRFAFCFVLFVGVSVHFCADHSNGQCLSFFGLCVSHPSPLSTGFNGAAGKWNLFRTGQVKRGVPAPEQATQ